MDLANICKIYGINIIGLNFDSIIFSSTMLDNSSSFRFKVFVSSIQIDVSQLTNHYKTNIVLNLSCFFLLHLFNSLPWNITTPLGYFGEILYHVTTGQAYVFTNGMTLLFFIAICLHHQAFFQMFEHSVQNIESNHQTNRQLCALIEFHNIIKRFVYQIHNQIISCDIIRQIVFFLVGCWKQLMYTAM